jgi:Zn-finger protein
MDKNMTYLEWMALHVKKHQEILKKLEYLSDAEMIEYFCYENMRKNEPDFCPLYALEQKCHETEELNCYLCGCPHFRLKNDVHVKSFCAVNSRFGKEFKTKDEVHQDCSDCIIPHKKKFIEKFFLRDWNLIMKDIKS